MKNFRIPVMGLATCALLFTSCAKTITKQEAIDFVKANYTSTEKKTPTKITLEFSGRGANDDSKDMIIIIGGLAGFKLSRDKLSDKKEITDGLTEEVVVNADDIQKMPDDAEFKLKGKELSVTMKETMEGGMTGTSTIVYTSEGYTSKMLGEGSCKTDTIDCSFTFNQIYTY